ncbi:hypothetical protein G7Y79_00079g100440 [Physcia stellaris]|nr:hypothetical protein G7Y79_00079g100440 [Physcia stellaris]
MDALPPPPSPHSPIPTANIQKLYSTLKLQISRLDTHIAHLNRLLKSTPHLDALLATTTYTLTLLTSLLPSPTSKPPLPTTHLSTHLTALTTLLSNLRITLRLFALPNLLTTPPHDPYLSTIAYLQFGASATFQVLENMAHLGDMGVLSVAENRRARWWLWCSRAWAVSVALEGGRLGRELVISRRGRVERDDKGRGERDEEGEEKEAKIARAVERERWWTEVLVNAAYAPMTLHWSFEGGLLPEGVVGALGMVAGGWG